MKPGSTTGRSESRTAFALTGEPEMAPTRPLESKLIVPLTKPWGPRMCPLNVLLMPEVSLFVLGTETPILLLQFLR